jgi:hypothetical protein
MRLNPDNPLVQAIYSFVGPSIERLRKELVEAQREQRETQEAKRLRKEASQIADIINRDFDAFRERLQSQGLSAGAGPDASEADEPAGGEGDDDFLYGGDEPATIVSETGDTGATETVAATAVARRGA